MVPQRLGEYFPSLSWLHPKSQPSQTREASLFMPGFDFQDTHIHPMLYSMGYTALDLYTSPSMPNISIGLPPNMVSFRYNMPGSGIQGFTFISNFRGPSGLYLIIFRGPVNKNGGPNIYAGCVQVN